MKQKYLLIKLQNKNKKYNFGKITFLLNYSFSAHNFFLSMCDRLRLIFIHITTLILRWLG